jgi:hypothetical protein
MANPLRAATKAKLYPFLASRGFRRTKSSHSGFVSFVRARSEKTDLLVMQWDKYGRERFVLNLCSLPGEHGLDSVSPFDAEWDARLQPRANSPRWWQTRKPLFQAVRTLKTRWHPDEVVNQVIFAFHEAEAWWSNAVAGIHVRVLEKLPPNTSLERTRGR